MADSLGDESDVITCVLQIIVDDYMKSESVLKASRMHDELDFDGELTTVTPTSTCTHWVPRSLMGRLLHSHSLPLQTCVWSQHQTCNSKRIASCKV